LCAARLGAALDLEILEPEAGELRADLQVVVAAVEMRHVNLGEQPVVRRISIPQNHSRSEILGR
jgi:hypothetical protein